MKPRNLAILKNVLEDMMKDDDIYNEYGVHLELISQVIEDEENGRVDTI